MMIATLARQNSYTTSYVGHLLKLLGLHSTVSCATDAKMQATSGSYDSPFQLSDYQLVDLSYGGRTLQMRPSQLTTSNIARAFRLIPETIILVSERDTVALPQDGVFHDVDDCYTWTVEGEKATTNISVVPMPGASGSRKGSGGESRWKPQVFPPLKNDRYTNLHSCGLGG